MLEKAKALQAELNKRQTNIGTLKVQNGNWKKEAAKAHTRTENMFAGRGGEVTPR